MDYADLRLALAEVVVTTPTPFRDGVSSVDETAAARHAAFLVENGVRVVVPAGNTGEFSSLSLAECKRLAEAVTKAVGDKAIVVVGVGGALPDAIDLAQHAERVGAHAVMVHHPTHTYVSREGVRSYYEAISAAVDIGVVLYKRGPEVTDEILSDVVERENVVAVKYADNDLNALARLIARSTSEVTWLCGTAERWAPFFYLAGVGGFTSGIANFAPQKSLALKRALDAGEYDRAMALRAEIVPIEDLRAEKHNANNVPVIKRAIDLLGLPGGGPVRPPLQDLDERDAQRVEAVLREWRLLPEAG